jgi:hypothetical protein
MQNAKQLDSAEFFTFIKNPAKTVDDFIKTYITYHGDLNFSHQMIFVEHLKKLLGPDAASLTPADILGQRGELKPAFLRGFSPVNAGQYFEPADLPAESLEILPESENDWQRTRLPSPMNMRLRLKKRPAVKIFKTGAQNIFIGPFGYQLFNPKAGTYAPEASSRAFSRAIEAYPSAPVHLPVVIIKDQYDGANFAHYLYDWIPRIIYFAQAFPDLAASCLYIMGGVPGPFQQEILRKVSDSLNIPAARFMFPQERYILQASGPIFYFSDQMSLPAHPLHMAHPRTIRAVETLFTNRPYSPFQPPLIYVSRRDARLRKIVNEDELARTLGRLGYVDICLSNFTAAEQRALFQTAESVVAPHGMGLTHLFFANPRCRVLELFHPTQGTDAYAFVATARGLRYDFLLGRPVREGSSDYLMEIDAVVEAIKTQAST